MVEKLDPFLLERLEEHAEVGLESVANDGVDVIVSLRRPANPELLDELQQLGFTARSVIGDIITGAVAIENLRALAASDNIITIEGGGALAPEPAEDAALGTPISGTPTSGTPTSGTPTADTSITDASISEPPTE